MKTLLLILTFIAIIPLTATSQTDAKVLAVVNSAEWCGVCQQHGERAMSVLKQNNADGEVHFIMNNVTNDETKEASKKELEKYGLSDAMADHEATGVAYFFDADNNEFIDQVSLSKDNPELVDALQAAINQSPASCH
ncbi:MAG: hypothetical protein R6U62_07635 [Bacteroidales bacterium]